MVCRANQPWCNPSTFLSIGFIDRTHIVPHQKLCLIQPLQCPDDMSHSGSVAKENETSKSLSLCMQMWILIICCSFLSLNNCLIFTFLQVLIAWRPYSDPLMPFSLREMNVLCQYCGAEHWLAEQMNTSRSSPSFTLCYHHGQVHLGRLPDPPDSLKNLYTQHTAQSLDFRHNIHHFNMALAFTSYHADEEDLNSHRGDP
jgi:hypothetical protein